ncbi:hypothetical protein ACQKCU_24350 [Heyndrickxia sporothermodurans]
MSSVSGRQLVFSISVEVLSMKILLSILPVRTSMSKALALFLTTHLKDWQIYAILKKNFT